MTDIVQEMWEFCHTPRHDGIDYGDYIEQIYVYLLFATRAEVDDDEVRTILMTVAGPRGREDVMNAGQRLIEQGRAEGLAKGKAEGLRTAIANVLSARGAPLSESASAKLEECDDIATLTRWHTRAVTAQSEAEVFAG